MLLVDGKGHAQLGGSLQVRHHFARLGQLGRQVQGERNVFLFSQQGIDDHIRIILSCIFIQEGRRILDKALVLRIGGEEFVWRLVRELFEEGVDFGCR